MNSLTIDDPNGSSQPNSDQLKWITTLGVITIASGSILIFFGLFNVYNYLYKRKKYKVCANIGIYVASIACLALNIWYASIVPINDFCNLKWFITSYTAAYCNLVLGLCQAYMLSMLKNQLKHLFMFQ